MPTIHGHEVLEMMMQAERPWPRAELERAIAERFGADARFHTCSAEGMTAAGLLDFLAARGKFAEDARGLSVIRARVCGHDHGEHAAAPHHHRHEDEAG